MLNKNSLISLTLQIYPLYMVLGRLVTLRKFVTEQIMKQDEDE